MASKNGPARRRATSGPGGDGENGARGKSQRPEPLFEKLAPRKNMGRTIVAENQRERLQAAMIEACLRHGYPRTTTRELIALANVSFEGMYQVFRSKEELFLETYDLVVEQAASRISDAYRHSLQDGADGLAGFNSAFEAFTGYIVDRPGAARLALAEILTAGPEALPRIKRAEAAFVTMIRRSLEQADDGRDIPAGLVRPLVGGIWFAVRNRLLACEDPSDLDGCGAEFAGWMLSYRTDGTVPAVPNARPPATTAEARHLRRAGAGDERTRIVHAAAIRIGHAGVRGVSGEDIAEIAMVDPAAVSSHFGDLRGCILATIELLTAEALARALREGAGSTDWGGAICRAVRALFCQVAWDPALARTLFVEPEAAGSEAMIRRAALMRSFAEVLVRRAPVERRPTACVAEAIVGAVWSLVESQVGRGRTSELPMLAGYGAFLTLAPTLGAPETLEVVRKELGVAAQSSGRRRGKGDADPSLAPLA